MELDHGGPNRLEIAEAAKPQELFLEGAKDALDASGSLQLAHESRGSFDSQASDLGWEVVAKVNAAMVMPQLQAVRGAGGKAPSPRWSPQTGQRDLTLD
jgi:hypothetical protein